MARKSQRNNILAGGFLIGSVALAVALSVILSDINFTRSARYTVRFSLQQGASGLKPGSDVFLGGQPVGKVTGIAFARDEATGRPVGIDVRVRVRADLAFFDDAMAFLDLPLLGTLSSINFPTAGGDAPDAARVEPGGLIAGRIAPPAFLAQAGYGPEEQDKVRRIIATIDESVSGLSSLLERSDPKLMTSLDDAQATLTEIRQTVESLAARTQEWSDRVDRSLADVNTLTGRFPGFADEVDAGLADARGGIEEARGVIRSTQAGIDENAPKVSRILNEAEATAEAINSESMPRLNRALDTFDTEITAAGRVFRDFGEFFREQVPGLRMATANARLASEQFKLVMTEVRQQPWRLLIRPTTKELQEQLVYDAARAYAEAVSNLRAASESLEATLASGDSAGMVAERATLEDLQSRLEEAFKRYQEAEQEMLTQFLKVRE